MDFAVSYVGEVLGNVSGGIQTGAIYEGLVRAGLDLDTGKLGLWPRGLFHSTMLYPHGKSLSENYVGDLFTFSNIDAPDSLRLFELWYEHTLVTDRLSIRIGQLAADEEFAGTGYGSTFINGTCGWPAIIAANVPSPAYPVATPGIRLALNLGAGWTFQTAVYNGQPCPVDEQGEPLNQHGVDFRIQDAFVLSEVRKEWIIGGPQGALPGSAKLGGWYHTGQFDDQRLDAAGGSLGNPNSTGIPLSHEGNWGVYVAAEQQVSQEQGDHRTGQGLGLFTRGGAAPADRNGLEFYAEGGVVYRGLIPGRDEDAWGLAIVYGQMSRDARAFAHDCNQYVPAQSALPDFEMVLETTYRVALHPGLAIQPVLAAIIHPGGSASTQDALIVGARATLDF